MPRHAGTNNDLLAMALIGYEAQKAKIDAAIREIQAKLGHRAKAATNGVAPAKRVMSAATRKRIGDAQRQRWAAVRKAAAQKTKAVAKAAPAQKAATATAS